MLVLQNIVVLSVFMENKQSSDKKRKMEHVLYKYIYLFG